MRTKQRAEQACGRRTMLAELGLGEVDGTRAIAAGRSRYSCRCPGCAAAQWDIQRLKYWICSRLVAFGADEAEVDQRVNGVRVDILWRRDGKTYAIEVRGGALDRTLALEHTSLLRDAGCDGVLWLCQPGYWVSHLPALGISDYAPPACDYVAVSGMVDTEYSDLVAPSREPIELREFLRGWVSGEIAWGYRDEKTGGWATVTDWERHTKTQATVIARQREELRDQRTALALSRKSVRDTEKQVVKLAARLDRAAHDADDQAAALAEMQRKLTEHYRVDATLRATIRTLQQTVGHWQLITCFAMLVIITFLTSAFVLL
ncbi:hypothetical protein [Nocardia puris]|uniref:hypothetical protein n=1 Tax=Nocardia puris TaxID=208602 RepID=UPI002B4B0DC0|nr:hypothetical protein [Nocardia puris]